MTLQRWSPSGEVLPVDAPTSPVVETRGPLPIIQATVTHWTGHRPVDSIARRAAFTGGRAVLLIVGRSPVGAWRCLCAGVSWVSDAEGRAMRRTVAHAPTTPDAGFLGGGDAFVRVAQHHNDTMKQRAKVAGLALLSVTGGAVAVGVFAPWWLQALLVVAVVVGLGVHGRPTDAPILARPTHSVTVADTPRITSELIVDALGSLGIGELNRAIREDDQAVRFVAPITRDGEGWRADVDLPAGVTAGDVIERRDRLASGLRRPVATVWPEADQGQHAGRLVLWVGDRAMSETQAAPWELTEAGRANYFEPFAFGEDQRGRRVPLTLAYASMVIGATPRMGKTASLRLILLAAALDPRCEIHAWNLKGGRDLAALAAVAHFIGTGEDDGDLVELMGDLRSVRADMRRRYRTLEGLPEDVAPDAKTTDELASRRDLGLHPVVVALDECQVLFEHPDHGKEAEAVITDLVKRGPAVGITVIVATQRPDAKALPSGIRANAVLRFCLMVTGQMENDMVLGTSAYRNGIRATMFNRADLGVGYLAGEGADPVIVRSSYVDLPTATRIAARARATRERLGSLSGMAAGDDGPEMAPSMPELVLSVWPSGDRARLQFEALAERLFEAGHDVDKATVSAALRAAEVPTVQVKMGESNRQGVAREAVAAAVARGSGVAAVLPA